jgi:hypothetical protein
VVVGVSGFALGIGYAQQERGDVAVVQDLPRWTGARVRVEVLNGGGVSGMAREATGALRDVGFDVVAFGNAAEFDAERPSAVIDRVGRPEVARAVAAALGIDNVLSEPDPNLYVDVTVVLGRAWTPGAVPAPAETGEGPPLWDPRSWFDG